MSNKKEVRDYQINSSNVSELISLSSIEEYTTNGKNVVTEEEQNYFSQAF
jgi:hypothetical protein